MYKWNKNWEIDLKFWPNVPFGMELPNFSSMFIFAIQICQHI